MIFLLKSDGSVIQGQFSSEHTRKHSSDVSESPYPFYLYQPQNVIDTQYPGSLTSEFRTINYELRKRPEHDGSLSLRQVVIFDSDNALGKSFKNDCSYSFSSPDKDTCTIIREMTSNERSSVPSPFFKPLCPFPHYDAQLALEFYKQARQDITSLIGSNLSPEDVEAIIKKAYPHLGYFLDYWDGIKFKGQNSYSFGSSEVKSAIDFWEEHGKDDSKLSMKDRELLGAYCAGQVNTNALYLIDAMHTRCRKRK